MHKFMVVEIPSCLKKLMAAPCGVAASATACGAALLPHCFVARKNEWTRFCNLASPFGSFGLPGLRFTARCEPEGFGQTSLLTAYLAMHS
jgi:hypothetical protein